MKLYYAILCVSMIGNNAFSMLAGVESLAANPAVQQLAAPAIAALVSHETNTFAHSSFFTNLVGHSHADQAASALQTIVQGAPAILQQAPGIIQAIEQPSAAAAPQLPQLPATNVQQAALGLALQAAQQTETNLQNNPSRKAQILRVLIGLCAAGFAAADLTVTYVYSQKNTNPGQKATTGVFSAGTDLGILSFGGYQAYLGFANWDSTAKQKDAAVATQLVRGHIAQLAQPAASAPAEAGQSV